MSNLKLNFLLASLGLPFLLFSQKYSVGIAASPSISTLRAKDVSSQNDNLYKPALGFYAGINIKKQFLKRISIASGFEYEHVAARLDSTFTDENGNSLPMAIAELHYDYIQIPVILEMSFGNETKFIFQIGHNLGVVVSSAASFDNFPFTGSIPLPPDINFNISKSTFNQSLIIGAGFEWSLNEKLSFRTIARSNIGIKDINRQKNGPATKTLSFFLSIGIQYHFENKN
ncbi:MAG: outer membrane beta-barrel protein [Saprospiraceae bacterium]|nr:outer membrane beta-barrel protein [Saprospiraceae bacterium]MCF8249295.1 outer membrane beta-barrel protein [Saprospiraceae bacterium]MCF8279716.1 outer membrane beta-barrel protein [Bacteroidales bacterium]MCF8311428.1 outer membrane beta-barrel protein [Saprospiraceae bacterium]MCF8439914.1 outer membrane beta-barrel protein [Saprospiraceae bacterium]